MKYFLEMGGKPVENYFCNSCEQEFMSVDWINPEVTEGENYPLVSHGTVQVLELGGKVRTSLSPLKVGRTTVKNKQFTQYR